MSVLNVEINCSSLSAPKRPKIKTKRDKGWYQNSLGLFPVVL